MIATDNIIHEACLRNVPAELFFEPRHGVITVARVRLLELTDLELHADTLMYVNSGEQIPIGAPITVHMSVNGSRYQFASAIIDKTITIQLNRHQQVRGIAMKIPVCVTSSQRRNALRISTVRYEPISASLARPCPVVSDACPVCGPVIQGWVVDLAVGGMGIVIEASMARGVKLGDQFFTTFTLPGVEDDFSMLVVVRHTREIERNESVRLGLAFLPWQIRQHRVQEQRLSRFVTTHERLTLKRRK